MLNNFSLTFSSNQDFFNGEKKCNLCLEAGKFRCHLGNTDLKSNLFRGVGGFPKILRSFQSGS